MHSTPGRYLQLRANPWLMLFPGARQDDRMHEAYLIFRELDGPAQGQWAVNPARIDGPLRALPWLSGDCKNPLACRA